MDPNSRSSCLPITGEDTGLEALASPLAGYLGKVQGRAASLDYCPWCTSKGLSYALRSYRISLQDSITVCTNPQCLFPLVSRSLEDVLASLDAVEPVVGNKRKNASTQEKEELIKPSFKRLRSSELGEPQGVTAKPVSPAEDGAVNAVRNDQYAAPTTDEEKLNGYHGDYRVAEVTNRESVKENDPDCAAYADGLASSMLSAESSLQLSLTTDENEAVLSSHCSAHDISGIELNHERSLPGIQNGFEQDIHLNEIDISQSSQSEQTMCTEISRTEICKNTEGVKSESEDLSGSPLKESEDLVPIPDQLLWRNSDNLCWLDSLLAALFNCKSLQRCKPKDEPQQSSLWQLLKGYEDICAAIQVHQQTGSDGIVRVPSHVLQKATADLQSLRMSVFRLLQPKLHCKLGQRETPVFAMPLLLVMDSWVECLFQATFYWEMKCSKCKTAVRKRDMKTLPTLTNIVPDWHPLKAAHLGTCNVCCKKNEMRTMVLESLPPVFALHFVEGLPNNDVSTYTFNFKGRNYSVTTVIQYKSHLKHFVTWTCSADGSWLEYDDLKYPDCKTHQKLQVPANEMHIVFWEVEDDKELHICSSSSTSALSDNERNNSLNEGSVADGVLVHSPDQSLLIPHNDTDIICALTEDTSSIMDTTVTAGFDTSIGATTLLDTFEGLTHSEIITLTLVEVKPDVEMQSLNNNHKTLDLNTAGKNETLDSTPDSSSAAEGNELHHCPSVDLPSTSSDPDSGDGSSSDPTFVPGARRGRGKGIGRGKTVSRAKGKKVASSKAALHTSPSTSSEPCGVNCEQPVVPDTEDKSPSTEITQQGSLMSSTDNPPLSANESDLTSASVLDQNARWSFLLSKHPLNQVQKSTAKFAPASDTQLKPPPPPPPVHSTPNPVKRSHLPMALYPKPQLRTEDSEDLPVKAADMYGAFHAKSLNNQRPLLSPTVQSQPVTSNHLATPTVMSSMSLITPGAKAFLKASLKRHGSHSSEVPVGLGSTEALRYKLLKQLKSRKKKLARINKMLDKQLRPDSTDLDSPSTVTSSTYDGATSDDFLSDLLSPATTASNLSPDSTGFFEMFANGPDGAERVVEAAGRPSEMNGGTNGQHDVNFLDEFLSQAVSHTPTDMETEALSALDLFI